MKKTYIFQTIDTSKEITVRGTDGLKKKEGLERDGFVQRVHEGAGIVTVIVTKFNTIEELEAQLA